MTRVVPPKQIDTKIDGKDIKSTNPEYAIWVALDQQVLGYLLTTMTCDVMAQVAGAKTSAELWTAVEEIFSSQTHARSMNTRIALTTLKKGNMSVADYMGKMKGLADELAAARKPRSDEEFVAFVINGLDEDYNPLVSSLVVRVKPIAYNELMSHLLSFEGRLEIQRGGGSNSSANIASQGRNSGGRGCGNPR